MLRAVPWVSLPLDQVCDIGGGGTPDTRVPALWKGDIPWISPKDMKADCVFDSVDHISELAIEQSATNLVPTGSVLMVVRSGILARTVPLAITARDLTINQDIKALTPKPFINPRFLLMVLQANLPRLLSMVSKGATVHRLDITQLRRMLVPVPSTEEQERIVAVLDALFAEIEQARTRRTAALEAAAEFLERELGRRFAGLWHSCKLTTLAHVAEHITDGDHLPPPKAASGIPFVTISNIDKKRHKIDFGETFFVDQGYFDGLVNYRKPRKGDLLYTVTGSYGISVIVDGDREFCFQRHIGLVRPKPETCSLWLHFLLRSPQLREQAESTATGTAQKTVSLRALRQFQVPLLSKQEQCEMASHFREIDRKATALEEVDQQKLIKLNELRVSLLHAAFTGKL